MNSIRATALALHRPLNPSLEALWMAGWMALRLVTVYGCALALALAGMNI